MNKRQRFYFIIFMLAALGGAAGLALYALQDNISYFYAPHEVFEMQKTAPKRVADGRVFRLGGMVKEGSVRKKGALVMFTVTDFADDIAVEYTGILPDLFREGQGVVATGALDGHGVFVASQLLAKHDEKYMPPDIAKALKKATAK